MTVNAQLATRQILLARHGQTQWNLEGRRQGQLDSPLTHQGMLDARTIAAQAARFPVNAIIASPLGRTRQTAQIIGDIIGIRVEYLDDLREVDHGTFAGLTNGELDARYPTWRTERTADLYHWRFPGGESYADAHRRAHRALSSRPVAAASCPLIITHEMIARMIVAILQQLDVDEAFARNLPHGHLLVFDWPQKSSTRS